MSEPDVRAIRERLEQVQAAPRHRDIFALLDDVRVLLAALDAVTEAQQRLADKLLMARVDLDTATEAQAQQQAEIERLRRLHLTDELVAEVQRDEAVEARRVIMDRDLEIVQLKAKCDSLTLAMAEQRKADFKAGYHQGFEDCPVQDIEMRDAACAAYLAQPLAQEADRG